MENHHTGRQMLEWITGALGAVTIAIGSGLIRGSQVQSQHAIQIRSLEKRMESATAKGDKTHDEMIQIAAKLDAVLDAQKRVIKLISEYDSLERKCPLLGMSHED